MIQSTVLQRYTWRSQNIFLLVASQSGTSCFRQWAGAVLKGDRSKHTLECSYSTNVLFVCLFVCLRPKVCPRREANAFLKYTSYVTKLEPHSSWLDTSKWLACHWSLKLVFLKICCPKNTFRKDTFVV